MNKTDNPLLHLAMDTDSYKACHWRAYPPKTTRMFSYLESRVGSKYQQTVFFGLQYLLDKYLSTPITVADVEEAKKFFDAHGTPFNYDGWMYIAKDLGGKLPVRIKAVAEGTVVPIDNILMSVESTDPKVFWIVSWLETMLVRLWYPITVATRSWHIKQIIREFLEKTTENTAGIDFMLHDFGSRGVSSQESAGIGGMAHLVNFMGSDTVVGVMYANTFYRSEMAAFSIPAAEHSTITAWGKENEVEAYRNMLVQYAKPGAILAVVSDSYDLEKALTELWGTQLKDEVINSGATVVIRPDSGNPPDMVLLCLERLAEKYGTAINSKGYNVLNNVKVIQGDGINEDSIRAILKKATDNGFSAENLAFGMGGGLLQQLDRDTQRFAFKCSEMTIDGERTDIYKEPKTDMTKKSKRGELHLVKGINGVYKTTNDGSLGSLLKTVYLNGEQVFVTTFDKVRKRATGILD